MIGFVSISIMDDYNIERESLKSDTKRTFYSPNSIQILIFLIMEVLGSIFRI